jgi:hypothetical protein
MVTAQTRGQNGIYYMELGFAPSLPLVTIVRRFVGNFFELVLIRPAVAAQLAVTVHELLENACKFSSDGDAFIRVEVNKQVDSCSVRIETRNHAAEGDRHILGEIFSELRSAAEPMQFYMARMERALASSRSQLGLARVAVEADMLLDYEVRGEHVVVAASRELPPAGEDSP